MSARLSTQHDALLARLGALDEDHRQLASSLASKTELGSLASTVSRRAAETETGLQAAQDQWKSSHEALEALRASLVRDYATTAALDALDRRIDSASNEMNQQVSQLRSGGEESRTAWEDKLMQRQLGLESAAVEARRDWHRLSAQVESVQTHVTERALRTEHDELKKMVDALQLSTACKVELEAVVAVAKAAAKGGDFQVLEADVRALSSAVKAATAENSERFGRAAPATEFASLEERVSSMQMQLEGKIAQKEAQHALANKLEKSVGEQIGAEVEAMQLRMSSLNERANEAELAASSAGSALQAATSRVQELSTQLSELSERHDGTSDESRARASDVHDLVEAVRALTADAEMRCALDERELEFLWSAPSHIYGAHGWRANNGSMSERTAYPVGNFKLDVRHGTEGKAKDVLSSRKKWLNSITVGRRDVSYTEEAAILAGGGQAGAPVRLPALDEFNKFGGFMPKGARTSRPDSPTGSSILDPAHALLSAHLSTTGGAVGVPGAKAYHAARSRVAQESSLRGGITV